MNNSVDNAQTESPKAAVGRCSKKICNIHRKTPVLESFLIKLQGLRPATLLKRDPTYLHSCEYCGIFKNSFFHRTTPVAPFFVPGSSTNVLNSRFKNMQQCWHGKDKLSLYLWALSFLKNGFKMNEILISQNVYSLANLSDGIDRVVALEIIKIFINLSKTFKKFFAYIYSSINQFRNKCD